MNSIYLTNLIDQNWNERKDYKPYPPAGRVLSAEEEGAGDGDRRSDLTEDKPSARTEGEDVVATGGLNNPTPAVSDPLPILPT